MESKFPKLKEVFATKMGDLVAKNLTYEPKEQDLIDFLESLEDYDLMELMQIIYVYNLWRKDNDSRIRPTDAKVN